MWLSLELARWPLGDVKRIEINEAFAGNTQECLHKWGEGIVNVESSAIAHGNAISTAGAALTPRLLHSMCRDGLKRGLVTLCVGVRVSPWRLKHSEWRKEAMIVLYLEDLKPGQRFPASTRIRIEEGRLKSFAAEFDPQPFHLDEAAASASIFRGLAASGWHTAAVTMRLLVDSAFKPAGGIVGAGVDELRWPRPVQPGDELCVESEVLEVRPSRSRPEQGLVKMRSTTLNQHGEVVQISVSNLVVPRRMTSVTKS
ncbi:TPA: MaoC family dehydratase N-terminal domain-containing protein [Pseudomonas aeruginosa]|nr:MaoC family dehydratase N-terminal domain-containing protein [Pseudomonas aeruginosa]